MGLWPTQGDEKRLGPATTLYGTVALSFCHPERSRGICGSAVLSWKCFSTERSVVERSAVFLPYSPLLALAKAAVIVGHSFLVSRRDRRFLRRTNLPWGLTVRIVA